MADLSIMQGLHLGSGSGNLPITRFVRTGNGTTTYAELLDPVTLTSDFEIKFSFCCPDVSATRIMIGHSSHAWGVYLDATTGLLDCKLQDATTTPFFFAIPTTNWADGKAHNCSLTRVGDTFTLSCDGESNNVTKVGAIAVTFDEVYSANSGTLLPFVGEILSVKFTDQSGAEDVITNYVLDNDSTVEQYARGYSSPSTKKIIYNSFATSDIFTVTLDRQNNWWEGVELLTNYSFVDGSTGWGVSGEDATHIATFTDNSLRYESDTTSPQLLITQAAVASIGNRYNLAVDTSLWVSGGLKSDTISGYVIPASDGLYSSVGSAISTILSLTRATTNVNITLGSISFKRILELP